MLEAVAALGFHVDDVHLITGAKALPLNGDREVSRITSAALLLTLCLPMMSLARTLVSGKLLNSCSVCAANEQVD